MQPKSLGLQTDLLFRRFEGEVIEKDDYIVALTPKNPGYRWGHFLLFPAPPEAGDLERWKAIFAKEVGVPPAFNHFVFIWDGIDGNVGGIEPFLQAGFRVEKTAVMTAQQVHAPPKINSTCTIRTFTADDWPAWIKLQHAMNSAETPQNQEDDTDGGFTKFLWGKANEYQGMIEAGLGQWFGAYVDGELASSQGLFIWNKLGRFQAVDTHPNHRRQGLAGTLVYHVAQKGLHDMGAETLVMCADPDYVAIKIYESIGFVTSEMTIGIGWHKK